MPRFAGDAQGGTCGERGIDQVGAVAGTPRGAEGSVDHALEEPAIVGELGVQPLGRWGARRVRVARLEQFKVVIA